MNLLNSTSSQGRLVYKSKSNEKFEFLLDRQKVVIGRDQGADLVVESPQKTVSRNHAVILRDEEGYTIEDAGSQNGVFVNGIRIETIIRLKDGDEISLGLVEGRSEARFKFEGPDTDASQTADELIPELQPYLVIRGSDGLIDTFKLPAKKTIFGGSDQADMKFPNYQRLMADHHFSITLQSGRYLVTDLGSEVGTRLNNRKLKSRESVLLNDNDVIRITDDQLGVSLGFVFHDPIHESATSLGFATRQETLVIQKKKDFSIGRSAGNNLVLASPTVSRQHAIIRFWGDRYMLMDQKSRNGTLVNGELINELELFDGDLIEIGEHMLVFQAGEITLYTSHGFRMDVIRLKKSFHTRKKEIQVLKGIDMTVLPREFLAIVGASGAGKTTFMRAINGTNPGVGKVLINGRDFYQEYDLFRHRVGYVPQFEILHTSLTPDQALRYAARLRLPAEMSAEEKNNRIEKALKTVSMDRPEVRSNRISNLSGGQRKRVSVAAELLADPKLIFLDEATSGLDPGLEKKMMHTFRRMADEGRTIILITHATANIVQADHVAILVKGEIVYYGPSNEALTYFDVDAFADIYDKIENEDTDWGRIFREEKPAHFQRYVFERQESVQAIPARDIKPLRLTLFDLFRQFATLTERAFRVIASDWVTLLLLMLLFPLTAGLQLVISTPNILTGDPIFLSDPVAAAADLAAAYIPFPDLNVFVFVMGLEAVLVGLFVPSTELLKERSIYLRERMINLKIGPYILSKFVVFTVFSFIQVVLYLVVLSLGVEYPERGLYFNGVFEIFLTLFFTMLAGNGLGLVLSAVSRNNEVSIYLLTLMLFFQFFFAGAVFDLRGKSAEPLSYLTTTRWSLAALGSTIDIEGITGSTVLCNTVDNPLTPAVEELTQCFHFPEATEDLMLQYGETELIKSWSILLGTMLIGLIATGFLVKRLDSL